MLFIEILLALLALFVAVISGWGLNTTPRSKTKSYTLVLIAILIMIFTVLNAWVRSKKERVSELANANLQRTLDDMALKLKNKIASDVQFEKWLKDSFFIRRDSVSNRPYLVANTFNTKIAEARDIFIGPR